MPPFTRCLASALAAAALCLLTAAPARAAFPFRTAHTTSLLPTGNLLIAGGVDQTGAVLNETELALTGRDASYVSGPLMLVHRASATATVMATGMVLVAGGIDDTGHARADAEIYDPATNSWTCVGGGACAGFPGTGMQTPRYNHTATLLNNGKVLICGGQDETGAVTTKCDLFTPSPLPAIGGSFSFAGPLQQARALQSSTLLKDGRVWIAGGWNPASVATNGWLPTTERYDPVSNTFSSAHPLASARGLHTATMMGDGRVLVAGGYNSANVRNNFGILESMEIYDPVGNNITPGGSTNARREMQAANLSADGSVVLMGGLGNVTTTYFSDWRGVFPPAAVMQLAFSGTPGVSNIVPTTWGVKPQDLFLSVPVKGRLRDADLVSSSPTMTFPVGIASWTPGDTNTPATGLQLNLNGLIVDCADPSKGPILQNCGDVKLADPTGGAQPPPLLNWSQGTATFNPITGLSVTGVAVPYTLIHFLNPGTLTSTSPPATIDAANFNNTILANVGFGLDVSLAGGMIDSGTFVITGGTFQQKSSYTVTLTGGYMTIPAGTAIGANGQVLLTGATFYGLKGSVSWSGSDPTYSTTTPVMLPAIGTPGVSFTGNLTYTATQAGIGGATLDFGPSTAVVRSMLFSDAEFYNPQTNATTLFLPSGGIFMNSPTSDRFGHTATLMPDNDVLLVGGTDCLDRFCTSVGAKTTVNNNVPSAPRYDTPLIYRVKAFAASSSLATARAFHTATLLPNGAILVAGGTNGPNVLATAELFDTKTDAVSPTNGPMSVVRDLHTATLLPNGRVLLAGGFSTSATSTGSTNTADIYYPDTKLFLPTAIMISSRSNHTASLMPDGGVMAVGGYGAGDVISATAEVYYATSAVWVQVATMTAGGICDTGSLTHPERALHTATLLKDGRLMVAGGINSQGVLSSVCAYSPATNSWAKLASMPHQLYSHTATLLFDGRVLVAGGDDGFGEYNASYIYDPSADAWTLTDPKSLSPLLQPRFGHTATLLPNDTVMISGGMNRFGAIPNEIETYHVNASSWAAGGTTFGVGPRSFHTMTLAPSGYVYAIGGSNGVIGGAGTSLYAPSEKGYFTAPPDQYSYGAPPSLRQSTISATSPASPFLPGVSFTASGLQFRGGTEASGGGAAAANSSFSFPHLILQRIEGSGGGSSQADAGFVLDLTTQIYLNNGNLATENTSLTVPLPALTSPGVSNGLPRGWYNVRTGANDIYANGALVQVGPAKPGAPTGLAGAVLGTSSIVWTWSAVAGVDGYDVYEATSMVFLGTIPVSGSPTFYQTQLAANTTASVVVAGYTASGDGPLLYSSTYFTLANPPSQVQVASVSFNSLLLEWNPNGNIQGALYEVSQSTDWPSPFSASVSTPVPSSLNLTASSVLIPNLLASTTYTFRVRTFNASLVPSAFSVAVTTLTRTPVASVTGAAQDQTTIQWNWINPGGVIYFNVYNATSGVVIATPTVSTFNDVGLGTNTPRSIWVSAVTAAGEGPLTPGPTHYTLAAAPGQVFPFLTFLSTGGFVAVWTANGNPPGTTYQAINTAYFPNPNNNKLIPAVTSTVTTTGLSAGFTGLSPAQYATVSVVALNGDGIASAVLTGSTYTFANAPSIPLVTNTTPVSISLSWNTQNNSTSTVYQITYSTDNFVANLATGVPFSAGLNAPPATLTGLITGTTYWVRIQAENPFGVLTQFSPSTTAFTNNGGVPAGSLAGVLTALGRSAIQGNLGNGRSVLVRSPGGAFPSDVTLVISSYNATTPLCPNGLNVAFSLAQTPAFQPSQPIYFSASYVPAELGGFAPSQVALMRYEPVSGTCVPLATTFDTTALTFTSELNHFSLYELAAVPLASDLSAARVFPNPFRAAHDAYVTIDRVPPGARVRVMTLRGEPVLDQTANGSGVLVWSATNGAGRSVASGLYLVLVDWSGVRKVLKLAVIR